MQFFLKEREKKKKENQTENNREAESISNAMPSHEFWSLAFANTQIAGKSIMGVSGTEPKRASLFASTSI